MDEAVWADIEADFADYVDRIHAYGNNAADGFLDLLTLAQVGDGTDVYTVDSPYRERAEAVGEHKNRLWENAEAAGMDVYPSHTGLARGVEPSG